MSLFKSFLIFAIFLVICLSPGYTFNSSSNFSSDDKSTLKSCCDQESFDFYVPMSLSSFWVKSVKNVTQKTITFGEGCGVYISILDDKVNKEYCNCIGHKTKLTIVDVKEIEKAFEDASLLNSIIELGDEARDVFSLFDWASKDQNWSKYLTKKAINCRHGGMRAIQVELVENGICSQKSIKRIEKIHNKKQKDGVGAYFDMRNSKNNPKERTKKHEKDFEILAKFMFDYISKGTDSVSAIDDPSTRRGCTIKDVFKETPMLNEFSVGEWDRDYNNINVYGIGKKDLAKYLKGKRSKEEIKHGLDELYANKIKLAETRCWQLKKNFGKLCRQADDLDDLSKEQTQFGIDNFRDFRKDYLEKIKNDDQRKKAKDNFYRLQCYMEKYEVGVFSGNSVLSEEAADYLDKSSGLRPFFDTYLKKQNRFDIIDSKSEYLESINKRRYDDDKLDHGKKFTKLLGTKISSTSDIDKIIEIVKKIRANGPDKIYEKTKETNSEKIRSSVASSKPVRSTNDFIPPSSIKNFETSPKQIKRSTYSPSVNKSERKLQRLERELTKLEDNQKILPHDKDDKEKKELNNDEIKNQIKELKKEIQEEKEAIIAQKKQEKKSDNNNTKTDSNRSDARKIERKRVRKSFPPSPSSKRTYRTASVGHDRMSSVKSTPEKYTNNNKSTGNNKVISKNIWISAKEFKNGDQKYLNKLYKKSIDGLIYVTKIENGNEITLVYRAETDEDGNFIRFSPVKKIEKAIKVKKFEKIEKEIKHVNDVKRAKFDDLLRIMEEGKK